MRLFLEESQTPITFAAIHDKNDETYKAHEETVPSKERLEVYLYDQNRFEAFPEQERLLLFCKLLN